MRRAADAAQREGPLAAHGGWSGTYTAPGAHTEAVTACGNRRVRGQLTTARVVGCGRRRTGRVGR
ncbi:hypothetical protein ACFV85_01820 [Streptomyces niveus]|uniref:hypothetical protein n=1 Tax=Streptomyces niveus TaxID=193462 RepID=UPI0036500A78